MLALPVRTVAILLGVPAERIDAVAEWAAAFASSITATASAADIEQRLMAKLERWEELEAKAKAAAS